MLYYKFISTDIVKKLSFDSFIKVQLKQIKIYITQSKKLLISNIHKYIVLRLYSIAALDQ